MHLDLGLILLRSSHYIYIYMYVCICVCGVISTHYNCICAVVLITLKMAS